MRSDVGTARPSPVFDLDARDDDDDDGDDDGRAGARTRGDVEERWDARASSRGRRASRRAREGGVWIRRLARGRARLERRESRGAGWVAVGGVRVVQSEGWKTRVREDVGEGSVDVRGGGGGPARAAAAGAFVVPEVYGTGVPPEGERSNSFIAMEYLNFGARGDQGEFGDALATMHLAAPSHKEASRRGKFGFERNNTIGETHQPNEWTDSWLEFWRDKRLMHMIRLARDPTLSQLAEKVVDKRLSDMFSSCGEIKPSLLHGDLWSGNIGTVGKKPSVFDPAVYYGHHEADFGMSWCAGFTPAFTKRTTPRFRRRLASRSGPSSIDFTTI